jgi:hypothetical protein
MFHQELQKLLPTEVRIPVQAEICEMVMHRFNSAHVSEVPFLVQYLLKNVTANSACQVLIAQAAHRFCTLFLKLVHRLNKYFHAPADCTESTPEIALCRQ